MRNPSSPPPTPLRGCARVTRAPAALLLALAMTLAAGSAQAQVVSNAPPKLRFAQDLRGDFALIGNTLAQDCRPNTTPRPLIGKMPPMGVTVPGEAACFRRDTSPDFFWTLNDWTYEATGATTQASAPVSSNTTGLNPLSAQSQAALGLPSGATVVYARLYWAATRNMVKSGVNVGDGVLQPDLTARLSRPGVAGFDKAITADDYAFQYLTTGNQEYQYQSTADITDIVKQYGAGRYQVSDVQAMYLDTNNGGGEYIFDGWWMTVFYEVPGSTKRHLKLYDSMRVVDTSAGTSFALNGFYVPTYAVDAKLGVVAFEGDDPAPDIDDTFSFNGQVISNDLNPANNFFNSTRSWTTKNRTISTDTPLSSADGGTPDSGVYTNALPISSRNDRPQLTGTPGSMSGIDLDVVDVSVAAGARSATASASTGGDRYWLAGFITSITTQAPDFVNTVKSVKNLTRTDGTVRPDDILEYTISTSNIGDDTSRDTVVNDKLPSQLEYVPGSLRLLTVAASDTQPTGPLTDAKGDDVGHYDTATRTLTVYLGKGATATKGGNLKGVIVPGDVAEGTSISFRMKVPAAAPNGKVQNQAIITAGGVLGIDPVDTPSRNPDGQGSTNIEIAIVPVPVIKVPASGAALNTGRPTYSGTALPGTTVTVRDENGNIRCTATTNASGAWSCTDNNATPLSEGSHSITARATNSNGQSDVSPARPFTVDTVKPAAPVITTPTNGQNFTTTQRPTLRGTAEPGATVIVSVDGRVVGRTTADSSGNWFVIPPEPLADGSRTVSAIAQDAAGNQSTATSVPFTITTSPPDTVIDNKPPAQTTSTSATFTFRAIIPSGGSSLHSFECSLNGAAFLERCALASATPPYTYTYDNLTNGRYTFRVRARNNAGNVDVTPAEYSWTVGLDTDNDGIPDSIETSTGTNPNDDDTDDDGIKDGNEDANGNGAVDFGETDPRKVDTDNDGLQDGTEIGLTAPQGTGTNTSVFLPDLDPDPSKSTDPLDRDTDKGGVADGKEDGNHNGRIDSGETNPLNPADDNVTVDSDNDGIPDAIENSTGTDPNDDDTDDDGIKDGNEDINANGVVDSGETDPRDVDTDNDGLQDGTELGLSAAQGTGTNAAIFVRDVDPATRTDPLKYDTDNDLLSDGIEDKNHNGRVDAGETNPLNPDTDGDSIADGTEDANQNGRVDPGETNPLNPDSDADGLPDGTEDKNHDGIFGPGETNPVNPDTDGDGLSDGAEDKNHNGTVDSGETNPLNPDSDNDGLSDGIEVSGGTNPLDDDTDDDGLLDGNEDANHNGTVQATETDPRKKDTDNDALLDGTELGLVSPQGLNTDMTVFVADSDPSTRTDPLKADTDNGGVADGIEDANHNGRIDAGETDPLNPADDKPVTPPVDSDGDGIPDDVEVATGTNPNSSDTDGDGIPDGIEDANHNGVVDPGETDPRNADSDGGGVPDGIEDANHNGVVDPGETDPRNPADDKPVTPPGKDTDGDGIPDSVEIATGTDPNKADTDGDGLSDGEEDVNHNGVVDPGETDPRNPDTDGGGVSDGDEKQANTNPLDGNDDLLVGGRGCSSSGGAPLAWLTMALLGLPWLRSRRASRTGLLGGLMGLAGVLSAPEAEAQATLPTLSESIDVQRYKPGPGATDLLGVYGSRVDEHLGWHLGASFNYASNPLGFYNPSTDRYVYNIVAQQMTLDVMGSFSLWNRFELGVVVPVTYQSSEAATAFKPDFADGVTGAGLGDVRVVPKLNLVSSGNLGLGLVVPVLLPSAGGKAFRGGPGVSARPQLIAEWGRDRGTRFVANLGVNLQSEQQLRNLRSGSEFLFGVGAQVPFSEKLALRANIAGSYGLNYSGFGSLPLEVLAALHYRVTPGLSAHVGGGPGLTRGYGTPAFRVLAGLDWHQPGERVAAAPAPAPAPAPVAVVDTDKDGIPDTADQCPTKPEDKDGFQDEDGCPDPDNDQDKRPDVTDRCPNEPETVNGFQDEDGCPDEAPPKDTDGDGIMDPQDKCPTQAEDKDGFQDEDGCPDPDNDQDGIPDAADQCPNEPEVINGVKDEDGCPDAGASKVRLEANRIVILDKVYFATAKDVILPKSFGLLKQVASVLRANPQIELLRVEGHTDDQGNDASNLRLSDRRAATVRAFLIKEGIDAVRLEAAGFGETKPVDTNKTAAGRENNRRVEFNILRMSGQDVTKSP